MGYLSVLIGIFDLAPFDFQHFLMNGNDSFGKRLNVGIAEVHSGKIDLKSAFAVHKGVFMTPVHPIFHFVLLDSVLFSSLLDSLFF